MHKNLQDTLKTVRKMYDEYGKLNDGYPEFDKGRERGESPDPWIEELSQQLYVNKEPTKALRDYRRKIISYLKDMLVAQNKINQWKQRGMVYNIQYMYTYWQE